MHKIVAYRIVSQRQLIRTLVRLSLIGYTQ